MVALSACTANFTNTQKQEKATTSPNFFPSFSQLDFNQKDSLQEEVNYFFNEELGLSNFNGMVLVAKNGEVLFEKYCGLADEEVELKFNAHTPLHVASISKTITAVTVLRLVDQGKVKLDKPVSNYLKGFPYKEIKVRHLLNHRSGLPYYGYFTEDLLGKNKIMTNQRLLRIFRRKKPPLNFPPDTHFAYCNTNYALLALIVEKVQQQSFPEAVQSLVFEPLKMKNSFVASQRLPEREYAKSYNSNGVLQAETELDYVYGDKNVYTTARDLLRFDKATYSDAFLSAAMRSEMFKGYSYENPGTANYGLGIRIRESEGFTPYFFHTGWWHGNTGCYVSMREDTTCMIMLSNHYTRKVFAIHGLSTAFGNYPYGSYREE